MRAQSVDGAARRLVRIMPTPTVITMAAPAPPVQKIQKVPEVKAQEVVKEKVQVVPHDHINNDVVRQELAMLLGMERQQRAQSDGALREEFLTLLNRERAASEKREQLLRNEIKELRDQVKAKTDLICNDIQNLKDKVKTLEAGPLQALRDQVGLHDGGLRGLDERVKLLETGPPLSEIDLRLHEIQARGNVRVDTRTGTMEVVKPIDFVRRKSSEEPTAVLANPAQATNTLDDMAEVAQLFDHDTLVVEGHTKGGENDFWQALADDRARLVVEELSKRGIGAERLQPKGLPGRRGLNCVAVIVKFGKPDPKRLSVTSSTRLSVSSPSVRS